MFKNEQSLKDLKYGTWVTLLTMTGATAWGIVTGNSILSFAGLAAIFALFVFLIFADKKLRMVVRQRLYDENTKDLDINIDTMNENGMQQPLPINYGQPINPNQNQQFIPNQNYNTLQNPNNAPMSQSNMSPQMPQGNAQPPVQQGYNRNTQPPVYNNQLNAAPPEINNYQRYFGPSLAVVVDGEQTYVFGPFRSTDEAFDWEPGARILFKKMMRGEDDVIMRGFVKAIPIASTEAKQYIDSAGGMILPTNPEWDFIRN